MEGRGLLGTTACIVEGFTLGGTFGGPLYLHVDDLSGGGGILGTTACTCLGVGGLLGTTACTCLGVGDFWGTTACTCLSVGDFWGTTACIVEGFIWGGRGQNIQLLYH